MSIDRDEIMRRVSAISPVLERNAAACDSARQLAPESLAAMLDAGMFRISQPLRNGGYELGLGILADAVTALSQACPSCGWVLMVAGAHHWCMGSFPEAAQDEVFGGGRDVLIAGTLSLAGSGGRCRWRLPGRWPMAVRQRRRPRTVGAAGMRRGKDWRAEGARGGAPRGA